MDFTFSLPAPLSWDATAKHYPSLEVVPFSIGDTTYWTAQGELEIGGNRRSLRGSLEEEVFTSLEISTLFPSDTFLGVSMALRPIRFQNQLHDMGIESLNDSSSLTLPEHNMSFYIFENELASICWTLPQSPVEA